MKDSRERIYPLLVAQNSYIRECAVEPGGLAVMLHPWETGMDNSPAWDEPVGGGAGGPLAVRVLHPARPRPRRASSERPTDQDYARYIRLALTYRDHGYDDDWARAEAEFAVVDPGFNALWAWSELALAEIATRLGQDPDPHWGGCPDHRAVQSGYSPRSRAGPGIRHAERRLQAEATVGGALPLLLPGLAPRVSSGSCGTYRAGSRSAPRHSGYRAMTGHR